MSNGTSCAPSGFPCGFHDFVEPSIALLLNEVGSVADCLLHEFHDIGFHLVDVSRRIVFVLAPIFDPDTELIRS
jgi:hypothetical protein